MNITESLLFIFMGWLLGLFSPIINDEIKKRRHRKEIKTGILTELEELRFKLTIIVYLVAQHFGNYDRELLNWMKLTLEDCNGLNQNDNIFQSIKKHLLLTDEELITLSKMMKENENSGISFKKYKLPFLDSKLNYLTVFDKLFQSNVFKIKALLDIFHEEIDQARFFYEKTFDSSVIGNNHRIICRNKDKGYKNIAETARRIADRIGELKIE